MKRRQHKDKSLGVSVIMNMIRQLTAMVFPVITFPYVARILQPEAFGVINYAQAVTGYFLMLAALGIAMYGFREVAKLKNDPQARDRLAAELRVMSLISTFLFFIPFLVVIHFIHANRTEYILFLIFSATAFFRAFGTDWYFGSQEEFTYLSVRDTIIRVLAVVAIFTLIKKKDDLIIYAVINVLIVSGGNILNVFIIPSRIKIRFWQVNWMGALRKHLIPVLSLFTLALAVQLFDAIDKVFLKIFNDDYTVGIFSFASRLIMIGWSLSTVIGATLVPRMSYFTGSGQEGRFNELAGFTVQFIYLITIPLCLGVMVFPKELTMLFGGVAFEQSVTPLLIMAPIIAINGLNFWLAYQIIIPKSKEMYYTLALLLTGVFNIVCNLILIPRWSEIGASWSALLSMGFQFGMMWFLVTKKMKYSLPFKVKNLLIILASTVIISLISFFIKPYMHPILAILLFAGLVAVSYLLLPVPALRMVRGKMAEIFKSSTPLDLNP